jgi:Nuclease-related domain
VAKASRRARRFARSAACQRLFRGFVPVLVLLWISGGIFGFLLASWKIPVVAGLCAIAVGLLYGSLRFAEANLEGIRGEWLKYAQGLDGERLVSSILDSLGNEWHVFHGLKLWQGQDFDHVVFGPGGLVDVQTKNWRGQITRRGDEVLRNGQYVSAVATVRWQAMQLKDRLSTETGWPVRWANAILAVRLDRRQERAEERGHPFSSRSCSTTSSAARSAWSRHRSTLALPRSSGSPGHGPCRGAQASSRDGPRSTSRRSPLAGRSAAPCRRGCGGPVVPDHARRRCGQAKPAQAGSSTLLQPLVARPTVRSAADGL